MKREEIETAAHVLQAARFSGRILPHLPEEIRPGNLLEGYEVQAALLQALGQTPRGYKIACTSRHAQEAVGAQGPFYGRLFRETLYPSPARLPARDFIMRLVEPEVALTLGRDLPVRPAPYMPDELAAAVARAHPAFEIVSASYGSAQWLSVGTPSLVADNGVHGAVVLGTGHSDWHQLDLASLTVRFEVDGEPVGEGVGANALGGPLRALGWLVENLSALGRGLHAGDVVMTGVLTPFVELSAGQTARADFGPLGTVSLSFE